MTFNGLGFLKTVNQVGTQANAVTSINCTSFKKNSWWLATNRKKQSLGKNKQNKNEIFLNRRFNQETSLRDFLKSHEADLLLLFLLHKRTN